MGKGVVKGSPKIGGVWDDLHQLGHRVVKATATALESLKEHDLALADRVVRDDLEINRFRYRAEDAITADLVRAGSVDTVRPLVAGLYVLADLERMGDHAEGIAKVALMLGPNPNVAVPGVVLKMGRRVTSMVERTLQALAGRDATAARRICEEDDEIDQLYDQAYSELLTAMAGDGRSVPDATYLLWVTHNLERIADRATNICERVVYLVTGQVEELNVSKY